MLSHLLTYNCMIMPKKYIIESCNLLDRFKRKYTKRIIIRRIIRNILKRMKIKELKNYSIKYIHYNRILQNGLRSVYLILPIFKKFIVFLINALAIWNNVFKGFLKTCKFNVNYINFMNKKVQKVKNQIITSHK